MAESLVPGSDASIRPWRCTTRRRAQHGSLLAVYQPETERQIGTCASALPATTLARIVGHSDPGFSLRVYAKDRRDEAVLVRDVLDRAQAAQIGG